MLSDVKTVKTFFGLIDRPVPDPDLCGVFYGLWSCQFLPNRVRFFAFQFYNNSLPTGTRVAARYRNNLGVNFDDRCVFCRKLNVANLAREDFVHVSFSCPCINVCIARYLDKYIYNGMTNDEKMYFFFTGTRDGEWTKSVAKRSFQFWNLALEARE